MMNTFRQQCLLLYLGYKPGTPDGIRGTLTADAIEDFQRDNGLGHDRLWGTKTEAKARYNFDHDVFKPEQEVADTRHGYGRSIVHGSVRQGFCNRHKNGNLLGQYQAFHTDRIPLPLWEVV